MEQSTETEVKRQFIFQVPYTYFLGDLINVENGFFS